MPPLSPEDPAHAGQAIYTPAFLRFYDAFVINGTARFLFGCQASEVIRQYDENVGSAHLDIGVGTGYFLDRCRFPSASPAITLMDLNDHALETTAMRLRRYGPRVHRANVLDRIALPVASFDSVGMNWLLHCVPGSMDAKAVAFANVQPLLKPGGVVFGSTLLGRGVHHHALARLALAVNNRLGVFSNRDDDAIGLERALVRTFAKHELQLVGSMAFFSAWR